jgi:hypothetical protein
LSLQTGWKETEMSYQVIIIINFDDDYIADDDYESSPSTSTPLHYLSASLSMALRYSSTDSSNELLNLSPDSSTSTAWMLFYGIYSVVR